MSELSLRASVACLIKVLFKHPDDGKMMLALERIATLRQIQGKAEITVTSKPFGGAVRLTNPQALKKSIGNFQYDSMRSRMEKDFRILIKPEAWEKIKDICYEHLTNPGSAMLDTNPVRELTEEFEDTIQVNLRGDQYQIIPRGISIEAIPVETGNPRAAGTLTARIYYLYEAWLTDPMLITRMLINATRYTDEDLKHRSQKNAIEGGKGRANAPLVLRYADLLEFYHSISLDERNEPISFEGHQIEENVLAMLGEVDQTRYKHYNG